MPHALYFLVLALAGWVNRHQENLIDYLREENRVLREHLGPRPLRLTDAQRRRLAVRGQKLGRRILSQVAGIVTPDTILRWYRRLIAQKYEGRARRRRGRPMTPRAVRVHIAGIHPQPDGRWMEQMARNLTDPVDGFLRTVRQLIHDCDPLYTRVFGEILTSGDVGPIRLPPKSPNLNAYAERFVRSIKEECLHRVVPLGEGHVRLIVHEYVEHDHRERNHQGLDNQLLQRPPPPVRADADVQRRERLGGLLSFYYREAA